MLKALLTCLVAAAIGVVIAHASDLAGFHGLAVALLLLSGFAVALGIRFRPRDDLDRATDAVRKSGLGPEVLRRLATGGITPEALAAAAAKLNSSLPTVAKVEASVVKAAAAANAGSPAARPDPEPGWSWRDVSLAAVADWPPVLASDAGTVGNLPLIVKVVRVHSPKTTQHLVEVAVSGPRPGTLDAPATLAFVNGELPDDLTVGVEVEVKGAAVRVIEAVAERYQGAEGIRRLVADAFDLAGSRAAPHDAETQSLAGVEATEAEDVGLGGGEGRWLVRLSRVVPQLPGLEASLQDLLAEVQDKRQAKLHDRPGFSYLLVGLDDTDVQPLRRISIGPRAAASSKLQLLGATEHRGQVSVSSFKAVGDNGQAALLEVILVGNPARRRAIAVGMETSHETPTWLHVGAVLQVDEVHVWPVLRTGTAETWPKAEAEGTIDLETADIPQLSEVSETLVEDLASLTPEAEAEAFSGVFAPNEPPFRQEKPDEAEEPRKSDALVYLVVAGVPMLVSSTQVMVAAVAAVVAQGRLPRGVLVWCLTPGHYPTDRGVGYRVSHGGGCWRGDADSSLDVEALPENVLTAFRAVAASPAWVPVRGFEISTEEGNPSSAHVGSAKIPEDLLPALAPLVPAWALDQPLPTEEPAPGETVPEAPSVEIPAGDDFPEAPEPEAEGEEPGDIRDLTDNLHKVLAPFAGRLNTPKTWEEIQAAVRPVLAEYLALDEDEVQAAASGRCLVDVGAPPIGEPLWLVFSDEVSGAVFPTATRVKLSDKVEGHGSPHIWCWSVFEGKGSYSTLGRSWESFRNEHEDVALFRDGKAVSAYLAHLFQGSTSN